jgi:hypothetical protein
MRTSLYFSDLLSIKEKRGGLFGDKVTPSGILSLTYAARATPRLADT